ncbi:unnamed protein product [Paramecium octaurelia]|uniref:Transmembrane protein n=1 Tax=Paramecium octaurelia TaxID=43137 RepID=A0A8S1XA22_PAROT|nr:unnamed protein product [Paramecium octaurelia]
MTWDYYQRLVMKKFCALKALQQISFFYPFIVFGIKQQMKMLFQYQMQEMIKPIDIYIYKIEIDRQFIQIILTSLIARQLIYINKTQYKTMSDEQIIEYQHSIAAKIQFQCQLYRYACIAKSSNSNLLVVSPLDEIQKYIYFQSITIRATKVEESIIRVQQDYILELNLVKLLIKNELDQSQFLLKNQNLQVFLGNQLDMRNISNQILCLTNNLIKFFTKFYCELQLKNLLNLYYFFIQYILMMILTGKRKSEKIISKSLRPSLFLNEFDLSSMLQTTSVKTESSINPISKREAQQIQNSLSVFPQNTYCYLKLRRNLFQNQRKLIFLKKKENHNYQKCGIRITITIIKA